MSRITKTMKNKIKIAFTGGGTGGHIYPGIAVAGELKEICQEKGIALRIIWLGNASGMDKKLVESAEENGERVIDEFIGVPSGKLRRYFSFQNAVDVFKVLYSCIVCFFILLKKKPLLLFSKGGFVSVPPVIAAKLLKIKRFTHECDFSAGLANRINAAFGCTVFTSYRETAIRGAKCIFTGNPVRRVFYEASQAKGLDFLNVKKVKPLLLVLGGSGGAKEINRLVDENLAWLCERFVVVHIRGKQGEKDAPTNSYYHPYAFIYEQIADVLAASDIVLSRAGASSVWESAVLKKPMILIPLSRSGTRGDQEENAAFFASSGGAHVLTGQDVNSEKLKEKLTLLLDEKERAKCVAALEKLTGEKASTKIAKLLFDVFGGEEK